MSDHAREQYCGCPSPEVIAHQCNADIARVGWHCVGVRDADAPYLYTVGLSETHEHPELVIRGLPVAVAHSVLHAAVAVIESGQRIAAGDQRDDVLQGLPVRFAAVDARVLRRGSGAFGVSDAHYGRAVERLQLIWPDRGGRFPGEAGMDERMAAVQDLRALAEL
jgi:hypothetical protein